MRSILNRTIGILRNALIRQWGFILIAIASVTFYAFTKQMAPLSIAILSVIITIAKEISEIKKSRHLEAIRLAQEMKKLAKDFYERFVNTSSTYSILYIIRETTRFVSELSPPVNIWADGAFQAEEPLMSWLQDCMRDLELIETNIMRDKELHRVCEEFERINHYYYQLVETYISKWARTEPPVYLKDDFNRFVLEYNAYVPKVREKLGQTLGFTIDTSRIGLVKGFS